MVFRWFLAGMLPAFHAWYSIPASSFFPSLLSAPVPFFRFRGHAFSVLFAPSVCLLAHPFSGAPRSTLSRSGFLFFLKKERECGPFPRKFRIFLQAISCVHARKLAKQTAIYGISTIAVRFLSYLLTPYYTRIFGQETLWYRHGYLRPDPAGAHAADDGHGVELFPCFSAKAEAGGDVKAAKRRLFATTWGVTSLAAAVFLCRPSPFSATGFRTLMGEAYVAHRIHRLGRAIILFDVWSCIPFSRLREQGRALLFVGLKALGVVLNVVLAVAFGLAGLFSTGFGVGWVFVANLVASALTWLVILATVDRTVPKINWALAGRRFSPTRCRCSSVALRVRPTSSSTAR